MPKMQLDAIDLKILRELQQNAEIPNGDLAERVGLSPSPCLRRVRILKEAGIIKRSVVLLEPEAIDLHINVFVRVTLSQQTDENISNFETQVRKRPEVLECYLMTGDEDYLLRVVVPDLRHYEHFLKTHLTRISGIANIRSSFALSQVSYSTALPLQHLI